MRHRKDLAKLGRPSAHRKALVGSLVRSLFLYDSIKTTLTKAKAAQRLAERLVSRSRRDDLAARRYVNTYLNDHKLVAHLFKEISPRFEDRNSGFTRIFILGTRQGDGAQMAVLEMTVKGEVKKTKKVKSTSKSQVKESDKSKTKTKAKAKEKTKEKSPGKESKKEASARKQASKPSKPVAVKKKGTPKQKSK